MKRLPLLWAALWSFVLLSALPFGGLVFGAGEEASCTKKEGAGAIIILNGTSSAGKTTLLRALLASLEKKAASSQWVGVSMDDIEDQAFGDYDLSEILADTADDDVLLFNALAKKIMVFADEGKNVVCDAVLIDSYFDEFVGKLKKAGYRVYTAIVYCSPERAVCNFVSRNNILRHKYKSACKKGALTKQVVEDLMKDVRISPMALLEEFVGLYEAGVEGRKVLGVLSGSSLKDVKASLRKKYWILKEQDLDPSEGSDGPHTANYLPAVSCEPRRHSAADADRLCFSLGNLIKKNVTTASDCDDDSSPQTISPRQQYDVNVDTTTDTSARQAVEQLQHFIDEHVTAS